MQIFSGAKLKFLLFIKRVIITQNFFLRKFLLELLKVARSKR